MINERLVQVAILGEIDDNLAVTGLVNNGCISQCNHMGHY